MKSNSAISPATAAHQPSLYKISTAMLKLDVSRATIYRMIARGDLALVKIGLRGSRVTAESLGRIISCSGSTE